MLRRIWLALPALCALLSACMPHNRIESSGAEACSAAEHSDKTVCVYVHEMHSRITHNFNGYEKYRGQQCNVQLEYKNHRYNVIHTDGDEPLCLKAWHVIGTADQLPAPPATLPDRLWLAFRPGVN